MIVRLSGHPLVQDSLSWYGRYLLIRLAVECEIYFVEPDTILVFTIFSGLFKGGTRLAMPNIMRAGLIVIEARFRGY